MLTVTLSGGGILLYLLGRGRKEQAMDREQAALMTAQQFINVKDIRDRFLYTRDGQIFMYLRVYSISTDLYSDSGEGHTHQDTDGRTVRCTVPFYVHGSLQANRYLPHHS